MNYRLLSIAAWLLSAAALSAQTTVGEVRGTVSDATGAVIAGVSAPATFGRVTAAQPARVMQMGLKFYF